MSSPPVAIQEITAFLRKLLRRRLLEVAPTTDVTLLPPGGDLSNRNGANLYLYRVVESPFTKNQAWRGNRARPGTPEPVLALQLNYLITPLAPAAAAGNYPDIDSAHLYLGVVMRTLHEHAILNDVHLAEGAGPGGTVLPAVDADTLDADIRNSYEKVKVTLLPTSVDDISRIWATLNQPYRLSVAYEASLVELIPTIPPPSAGGIVLSTGVKVITLDPPRLSQLTPATGALARIVDDNLPTKHLQINNLQIDGFGLSFPGQTPRVRVGGIPVAIQSTPEPTNEKLSVALPGDLQAGPQIDVRVSLNNRESTPLIFTVTPWLASTKPLRADPVQNPSPTDLKLLLTGSGFGTTRGSIRFTVAGTDTEETSVSQFHDWDDQHASITIPNIPNGLYDVRLIKADLTASNKRTLEILPLISKITVTPTTLFEITFCKLTIAGVRLAAKDVRIVLDRETFVQSENTNPGELVIVPKRQLTPGPHTLAVTIDGHTSRTMEFPVP